MQSVVNSKKRSGDGTQPWGSPVLVDRGSDVRINLLMQLPVGEEVCAWLMEGSTHRHDGVKGGAEIHKQYCHTGARRVQERPMCRLRRPLSDVLCVSHTHTHTHLLYMLRRVNLLR